MQVKRAKYNELERRHEEAIPTAYRELRRRLSRAYWQEVYPVQAQTMDYSQLSFPAYKFVLPEVIADDWLATVGWHKFNRDHVLHQPLTAYVVLKLLTGGGDRNEAFHIPGKGSLLNLCVDEILKWSGTSYLRDFLLKSGVQISEPWLNDGSSQCRKLWECLFVETAYIAALFHDMGYPWQYINILGNKLEHIGCPAESPTTSAAEIIKMFGKRLMFCPLNGYRAATPDEPATWRTDLLDIVAKALKNTHGFPGAIGFLYMNDILRDYPGDTTHPIRKFCIEWAAMAVLMHDMPKIYWGHDLNAPPDNTHMRLKFDVDPLSCVIALADVLEDFSRPSANFSHRKHDGVRISYPAACDSSVLEITDGEMGITYGFNKKVDCAVKKTCLPDEAKRYFDSKYGYLDLSALGVRSVKMFTEYQRK